MGMKEETAGIVRPPSMWLKAFPTFYFNGLAIRIQENTTSF
jgi:hypothetical protein